MDKRGVLFPHEAWNGRLSPTHDKETLVAISTPSLIRRQLAAVRRSLSAFDRSLSRLSASLNGGVSSAAKRPRARKLSARARAAFKLQGRYMGFMRQLKPRQKAQVRKIRAAKGVTAAIARAKGFAEA